MRFQALQMFCDVVETGSFTRAAQRALLQTHPKVHVRLKYRCNDLVYQDVQLGASEIGLVAHPRPRAGIDILLACQEKLTFVCAPAHPLAQKGRVRMAAVAAQPFIAFNREALTRQELDEIFRENGLEITPVMEADNVETIKRAVEMGLGVSVLPALTVQDEVANGILVSRPFSDCSCTRPIGILVRKGRHLDGAVRAVLEAFRSARIEEALRPVA